MVSEHQPKQVYHVLSCWSIIFQLWKTIITENIEGIHLIMRQNSWVFCFSGKNCCEMAMFFTYEVISRGLLSKLWERKKTFFGPFRWWFGARKVCKKVTLVYHYSTGAKGKMAWCRLVLEKPQERRGRGDATATTEWKELHLFWSHYGHFRPGPCQPDGDDNVLPCPIQNLNTQYQWIGVGSVLVTLWPLSYLFLDDDEWWCHRIWFSRCLIFTPFVLYHTSPAKFGNLNI